MKDTGLIPPHGGYRKLRSFQCAQMVYDATVIFCDRFIEKRSRNEGGFTERLYRERQARRGTQR